MEPLQDYLGKELSKVDFAEKKSPLPFPWEKS